MHRQLFSTRHHSAPAPAGDLTPQVGRDLLGNRKNPQCAHGAISLHEFHACANEDLSRRPPREHAGLALAKLRPQPPPNPQATHENQQPETTNHD
jgi:hypothetical protein